MQNVCRCLEDNDCHTYKYQHARSRTKNCILIHSDGKEEQVLENTDGNKIYIKGMFFKSKKILPI